MACEIVAAIKQGDHIFLIKRFFAGFAKIGWNARKVEIYSVALRDGIDTGKTHSDVEGGISRHLPSGAARKSTRFGHGSAQHR